MTREDFIQLQIMPILGDYADDFDIDAICDEVSDYDERDGYVWKAEYDGDIDALNEVLSRHDKS